ncbi:MAG: sporulation protein YqfD [Clostridia bacterium]|nr:sporulation protein YqfD [Clostridia bacterium]
MKDYLAFFQGRVDAEARGNQIEQFINLLHRRRIPLRKPRRTEEGALLFTVSRKDFKRLREPAFKTGTRIRIRKKRGLFMVARPFKKRWGLAVGLALFLGFVFYSSGFIWQIEIIGCEETSATQIRNELQELGLGIGTRRTVKVNPIENRYLTGNDKLSWMSINIRGTTAYVEVQEKDLHPEMEDTTLPTNIYAARDGVILSIMDYGGTRQVQAGEPVAAGDLLVSGDWTDKYGVRHLTHSIATVWAETRHETDFSVPLTEEVRQKTGKSQKKFAISFGKLKIPLYFTQKISYNEYDTVQAEYPLRIASFAFPIRFYVTKAEEVERVTVTRTAEEAKALVLSKLGFYREDVLADVTVRKCETEETLTEEAFALRALFYCEEEIGISMPIEE